MRRSELESCLPAEDVRDARRAAIRAGAGRAAITVVGFAAVYAVLAASHLVAPEVFPSLTEWPMLAHAVLLGLGVLTCLRDGIAVGRSTLMDALHAAYLRQTSGPGGQARSR